MNDVFVTGGLGFIRSNFISLLLDQADCEWVINLDKRPRCMDLPPTENTYQICIKYDTPFVVV